MTTDYGSDLAGTDDLDPFMTELDGTDVLVVAQAIYRRLTTAKGSLIEDPDYGLDVRAFLRKAMTPAYLASIPGQIENEITKDDRITNVVVRMTDNGDSTFDLDVSGETADGEFTLTAAVSADGVILKEIQGS